MTEAKTAPGAPPDWNEWRRKLAAGEVTLTFAPSTRGGLLYEIPRVLYDIDPWFMSDESHLGDFSEPLTDEVQERAREAWGIEIPTDPAKQYVWMIADLITGRIQ